MYEVAFKGTEEKVIIKQKRERLRGREGRKRPPNKTLFKQNTQQQQQEQQTNSIDK